MPVATPRRERSENSRGARAARVVRAIEIVAEASPDEAEQALARARRHLLDWLRGELSRNERGDAETETED